VTSLPSSLGSLPEPRFEEIGEQIVVVEMSDGIAETEFARTAFDRELVVPKTKINLVN
jgi:hypothetical protein